MELFDRIIFKENYTMEDLKKEKRIIFFDIDSTLGGSSLHNGMYSFPEISNKKKEEFEVFKKRLGVNFSFMDYRAVEPICLGMFLRTLKDSNAVGFCLSSWVISCKVRGDNANINPIKLIEEVFIDNFSVWERGIIVGGIGSSPMDRGNISKKIADHVNSDYFVIDDSHHEYDIRDGLIEVDGNCGYIYRNHREIMEKWIKKEE